MLSNIGELAPKRVKDYLSRMLSYSGMRMDSRDWIGAVLLTAVLFSTASYAMLTTFSTFPAFFQYLLVLLVFLLIISMMHTLLYF
ncbi:hypothetical protein COY95_01850, partial [Candidatus Woesearchaeota archaeon CG_4_10_14_0_8_um_filter_47_5]